MISTLSILFTLYILIFLYSLRIRDNSIVDVFWWGGFMVIAILTFIDSMKGIPQIVTTGLIILWWLRIVWHIGIRKLKDHKEDPRYAKWREEWWNGWYFLIRSFLQVYMFQMILMLIVATPIFIVNLSVIPANAGIYFFDTGLQVKPGMTEQFLLMIWTTIALVWLIFETIADRQLSKFINTKKPWQIFTWGLYRYSRHPNYFGESVFWLGISLIALPFSYLWLIGWMTITFLLLFVSWVPLQEARYIGRPEWEVYKSRTSVLIPWWPKK